VTSARRPLVSLYVADAVSRTGNVMTLLAIPWFVLQTSGSAAKTGVVAAFHFLPVVVASFFGGTLVDRFGFRRMSVISDVLSAATVAAIPALHLTVGLPFGILLVLVFLGALLDTPGVTARRALLPDAAIQAGWTFERTIGVSAAIERGSRLAGAPFAGVLMALFGAVHVLWIDAATFLVSAALVALGVPRSIRDAGTRETSYLADLKDGFRFLRSSRVITAIVVTVCLTNFIDSSVGVLLPLYADEVYSSPVMLGIASGALGGGSVIGALVYAARGRGGRRFRIFASCFVVVSLEFFVLGVYPPLAVVVGGLIVAGAAAGPLNPIIDTVVFEQVPAAMRGRVLGAVHSAAWMSIPLGVMVAGFLAETIGLRATLISAGIAYLAITASIWLNPAMREMDPAPEPGPGDDQESPQDVARAAS
jgi:MFS family permease